MKLTALALFLALAAPFFVSTSPAAPGVPRLDPAVLHAFEKRESANLLITLRDSADLSGAERIADRTARIRWVYDRLRAAALKAQAPLLAQLRSRKKDFRSFYLINAVAVKDASPSELRALTSRADIRSIALDTSITLHDPKIDPLAAALRPTRSRDVNSADIANDLVDTRVDQVWNKLGVFGKGIVIASEDTGFAYQHPALAKQYRGNTARGLNHDYNWHDAVHAAIAPNDGAGPCGFDSPVPCDDQNHGTHTMGTMIGDDGGENKIGVAPQAQWIGCRNMDRGVGMASSYLECFEYFLAPYVTGADPKTQGHPEMAPHIINNSWACPKDEGCNGTEFLAAVRALKAAGILVIAAAGNDGPDCATIGDAPGSYTDDVLAVAAYDDRSGEIADFSSRGPSAYSQGIGPGIAAPGVLIRSSVPSGGMGDDGLYDVMDGTSMAAPHVAGVAALLWSAHPELIGKIPETIARLELTARPKPTQQTCGAFEGAQVPNAVFGHGLIDAYAAITQAAPRR